MIKFEDITSLFNPDFDALRAHIRVLEQTLPKAGSEHFNGWTVMGKDGKHTDGWIDGSKFLKKLPNEKFYWDFQAAHAAGYHPSKDHLLYTNAANPELIRLIEQAKLLGLTPCRARLIQLVPGAVSNWHTDGTPEKLALRLHVVIETNEKASFVSDEGPTHLPADRVYLINVNYYHRVENLGDSSRTHLVVDVTDTHQISKAHCP